MVVIGGHVVGPGTIVHESDETLERVAAGMAFHRETAAKGLPHVKGFGSSSCGGEALEGAFARVVEIQLLSAYTSELVPAASCSPTLPGVPVVTLRAPLRDLVDGKAEVQVEGRTVGEAVRAVEDAYPPIRGWILDEHGNLRAHVNVFVDGERSRETTPVEPDAVLHVLSAISGGER